MAAESPQGGVAERGLVADSPTRPEGGARPPRGLTERHGLLIVNFIAISVLLSSSLASPFVLATGSSGLSALLH
ncbi:MAG: hypothetical protein LBU37_00005 [Tannerellaceae bacterium]|nr:hypothetical protein [Tannerellaceae bacterium]